MTELAHKTQALSSSGALPRPMRLATAWPALSALVVDGDPTDRQAMRRLLTQDGIKVRVAACAADAIALCQQQAPDLVFCEVLLPDMDGCALAGALAARFPDPRIPVIFVSALSDARHLLRCIEAGGDDIVLKPVNPVLLRARVEAALRFRELHRMLAEQRDELARYRAEMLRDMSIAKSILDNLATSDSLAAPNVRHVLRPMETLNGDLIMAARAPSRAQVFMVGDFTGHGLPAAIGVLVVHGIFCSMVAKGLSLEAIATELNRKMYSLLPVDRFLSAALIEVDPGSGIVSVWNGGMPDILVRGDQQRIAMRFPSTNLPLGVLPGAEFDAIASKAVLNVGDTIYAYSDGLVEATAAGGAMFGAERLRQCIESDVSGTVDRITAALAAHMGATSPHDDISLLEVRYDPEAMLHREQKPARAPVGKAATAWRVSATLGTDTLKGGDPIPVFTTFAEALQGFGQRSSEIYLIISELFSNALEHGLLGLDSSLKHGPQGFTDYYLQREQRLAQTPAGAITITLAHEPVAAGGVLEIRLQHTGTGFPPELESRMLEGNTGFSGRGIALVRSLCASLEYRDAGRMAVARYAWTSRAN